DVLRGSAVRVDAPIPLPLESDGEVLGTTPARFEIMPHAFRVRVPIAKGGPSESARLSGRVGCRRAPGQAPRADGGGESGGEGSRNEAARLSGRLDERSESSSIVWAARWAERNQLDCLGESVADAHRARPGALMAAPQAVPRARRGAGPSSSSST